MCKKILLCIYSTVENVYKNGAVDLWIECYTLLTVALHIK